jgi:hypothetical protein
MSVDPYMQHTVNTTRRIFPKFELCPPDSPRATHFEIKIHTHLSTTDPHSPPSLTKKTPSTGPAHHTAPLRASGRSRPPPTSTKPRSHQTWSCAANTRNPLQTRLSNPLQTRLSNPRPTHTPPHPTTNPTWSICLQTLTTHPRTNMCYCGIGPRMRPSRTTTTPGAITRDVRSLHSTLCPNHPQPPKTWARLWNPHLAEDSIRLLSSPPPSQ